MEGPKGQAPFGGLEDAAAEIVGPEGVVPGSTAAYGHADAFGETSNPDAYVAREACDAVLSRLERSARERTPSALFAQPGLGKTVLLRVLMQRLEPKLRCVLLPYAALDLRDLSAWSLGLLGEPPSDEPEDALASLGRSLACDDSALLLLIDDAGSMPIETARALGELVSRSEGSLRVVLAANDEAASRRAMLAVAADAIEVRIASGMTVEETERYLHRRLEIANAPPVAKARFGREMVARIHRLSGGVPRRVHELATTVLTEIPTGVDPDEDWLGGPLDELEGEAGDYATDYEALLDDDLEPLVPEPGAGAAGKASELGFFRRLLSSG